MKQETQEIRQHFLRKLLQRTYTISQLSLTLEELGMVNSYDVAYRNMMALKAGNFVENNGGKHFQLTEKGHEQVKEDNDNHAR